VSFSDPAIPLRTFGSGTLIRPLIGVRRHHLFAVGTTKRQPLSRGTDLKERIQDSWVYLNTSQLQAGLNSSNPATALNPFQRRGRATPQAVQSLLDTFAPSLVNVFYEQNRWGQASCTARCFNFPPGDRDSSWR